MFINKIFSFKVYWFNDGTDLLKWKSAKLAGAKKNPRIKQCLEHGFREKFEMY